MLSVSYAGKNVLSAGRTSGVLRGSTSIANRGYVPAHCAPQGAQNRSIAGETIPWKFGSKYIFLDPQEG